MDRGGATGSGEDGNGNWHGRKEEIMAHYWHWHTGGRDEDEGKSRAGNREHTAQWEHDVCHDEAVYIFPHLPLPQPLTSRLRRQ